MLNFNRIVDEVCDKVKSPSATGISKTASRNHYEWTLPDGLRTRDRVRLDDGREGTLTSAFPGCRGDGDWCGIFLDDGSEENIRPDRVAAVLDKPTRRTADDGQTVRYVVEFRNLGTDHMSARMTRRENGSEKVAGSRDHERSADLLRYLVEFEDVGSDESPPPGGIHGDAESILSAKGSIL